MRNTLSMISILIIILSIFFPFSEVIDAKEEKIEILDSELYILEDVPLIEFGEESTIPLRFIQLGFNWTYLSTKNKQFWLDFIIAKIYYSIIFRDIKYLLGYNSVVFEVEVLGEPYGWEAWVSPGSITNLTGGSIADIELHVKVSRPTTVNTAKIRINYTAYSGGSYIMGIGSNEVLVSVGQYHLAEINVLEQHKKASPDSMVNFPIIVTNRGNYEDTFGFEVSNENNGFIGSVSGHLTLKSGETGKINATVLTPDTILYDFGTQTSINISAYSLYEPSKKFVESISITSKGFLISEIHVLTLAITTLIIIIISSIIHKEKKTKKLKNNY